MNKRKHFRAQQSGFSLLELVIVLALLGVISAAVLSSIGQMEQRAQTEQSKVDDMQEARDFVDQFFRDINQIGYPNVRMVDTTSSSWSPALTTQTTYNWASPYINDKRFAIGLVKIDSNTIQFEADSNGDGNPESIVYMINGSGSCTYCLQRSQVNKVNGSPLDPAVQVPNWGTEVNDVISTPIFTYYDGNGNQITSLPADISTAAGAQTIATVKVIKIALTIRNNMVVDPKTSQPIETNFEGEVSLNNCSMAASGQPMSC